MAEIMKYGLETKADKMLDVLRTQTVEPGLRDF
jgi:hypothetical protein